MAHLKISTQAPAVRRRTASTRMFWRRASLNSLATRRDPEKDCRDQWTVLRWFHHRAHENLSFKCWFLVCIRVHSEHDENLGQRQTKPPASHPENYSHLERRHRLDPRRVSWHKLLHHSSELKFRKAPSELERPDRWTNRLLSDFRLHARLHVYLRVQELPGEEVE